MRRAIPWLFILKWCVVTVFVVSNAAIVSAQESGTIRLSPTEPSAEWSVVVEAPGYGVLNYKVFRIDLSSFRSGGVLTVDVYVEPDSETGASFNIFPEGVRIPTEGHPSESVAGAYDVQPGVRARLEYRFERGQTVSFGADGNWFSPTGARGGVLVRASVVGAPSQGDNFDGTYMNSEFAFAFRIQGRQGVATMSNSPNYQVGDVMLRFVETSPTEFGGEQLCTDGIFHAVTGVLNAAGDLEMSIEGCSPTRYTMVRQRGPAEAGTDSSSGAAADTTGVPFARGQVWRGQYLCSQGWTDLDLVILGAEAEGVNSIGGLGYRVSAIFDFNFGHGAAEGAFFLNGTFRSSDRATAFRAREWIRQPDGYVTVDMEGQVSADGKLFSGIIPGGCGAFAVRRTSESWVQENAPASGLLGACGSEWWQRAGVPDYLFFENSIGIAGFRKPVYFGQACLAHDSCYGRTGSQKSTCDSDFLALLKATCDETLTGGLWAPSREKCRSSATGYFLAVSALGCEAFSNAQRMAGTVDPSCD